VFQKFSLILAVTTEGAQLWQMYDKGSVFVERLEEFLHTLLEDKKGYLVFLDNAPAHKKASIEELILKTGNELLYTVPYQPKTNVVEQIFSELKHHLSDRVTRKFPELKKAVGTILEKIKFFAVKVSILNLQWCQKLLKRITNISFILIFYSCIHLYTNLTLALPLKDKRKNVHRTSY